MTSSHIEHAIKEAVEKGGYEVNYADWYWSEMEDAKKVYRLGIFLDPFFWEALGKARGWKNTKSEFTQRVYVEWLEHWHRFIDHLAAGKDTESFFATLV